MHISWVSFSECEVSEVAVMEHFSEIVVPLWVF